MQHIFENINRVKEVMVFCSGATKKFSNEELRILEKELHVAENYVQDFHTCFNQIKRQINEEIGRRSIEDKTEEK